MTRPSKQTSKSDIHRSDNLSRKLSYGEKTCHLVAAAVVANACQPCQFEVVPAGGWGEAHGEGQVDGIIQHESSHFLQQTVTLDWSVDGPRGGHTGLLIWGSCLNSSDQISISVR